LTLGVKVLSRSAFEDWPLPLTNDFVLIAITNGLQPVSLPYDAGYLITLVPHGQSEVPLVFCLFNDSDEIVELAEVKVSVSSEIPCVYRPGWGNPLPDASSTNLWFEYAFSRPFLPSSPLKNSDID
jgi:hypothetical protein